MSGTTQKPLNEPSPAVPTFSYAQAAKGRSPSGPSSLSTEKIPKGDQDGVAATAKVEDQDLVSKPDHLLSKRATSEGHNSLKDRKPMPGPGPLVRETPDVGNNSAADIPATQASAQSQVVVSTPSSPEFGVTSASTLPKDDDMFSNANGSSDSTWEKLSQGSQNGSKSQEKGDNEKEPNESPGWDEAPPPAPGLKEAPPPAVNIWTQRIEAKAAKQPIKSSSASPVVSSNTTIGTNNAVKPFDIGAESRRHDNKKQSKRSSGGPDEKPATIGAKEGEKFTTRRSKNGEFTEHSALATARAPNTDRSSTSMAPPPPPGDSVSWPTPDGAQDEGRKKAQERVEKGEKEKSAGNKPHSKEKWMPVPYVPSVQFNTPIPTLRRGARAPRGGRESGPRIAGSGAERPRATSPDAAGGPQSMSRDRGKAAYEPLIDGANGTRLKRASSAGPPSLRGQRRSSESTSLEKRNDNSRSSQTANQSTSSTVAVSRRPSAAAQDGGARAKGPVHRSLDVDSQAAESKGHRNYMGGRDRYPGASDTHAHPRSAGFERRAEGPFRNSEHARDYHNAFQGRERYEGRPERGRGGHRSRGGSSHTMTHASMVNGHVHPQPFVPPSMPTKSYSNHERRASQVQNVNFQSPPSNGRPMRSTSRSHSITHPSTFARYPQGPQTTPGSNLPHLHTDGGDGYGYQPNHPGVMSANPYTAYMEQMSIFGMVSMQM